MLRVIIIRLGRMKNKSYNLPDGISSGNIAGFLFDRCVNFLRGMKLLLRGKKFSVLFLGRNSRIRGLNKIKWGKFVQVGDHVSINAYGTEGLTLGDYSWIGSFSCLKVSFGLNDPGKFIRIGKRVGLGEYAHLGGAGGLEIGDDCIIGPYLSCHPENHNFNDPNELIRLQGVTRKGIFIGKNCWIGAKVTVLDGVTIGDNCIIAAGAVITKDMPADSVIGGVPAKIIRKRNADDLRTRIRIEPAA